MSVWMYKEQKIMFLLRIQTKWPIMRYFIRWPRGRISNTLLHRCPFSRMPTVHAEIRICVRRHVWEHAGRFSFLSNRNWLRKPTPAELLLHAAKFPFFSAIAGKQIFSWEVALNTLISCTLSHVGETYK